MNKDDILSWPMPDHKQSTMTLSLAIGSLIARGVAMEHLMAPRKKGVDRCMANLKFKPNVAKHVENTFSRSESLDGRCQSHGLLCAVEALGFGT